MLKEESLGYANISSKDIKQIRRRLLYLGEKLYFPFPWRETGDPWQILIAELLLQRTRASSVVSVYSDLIQKFPSPLSIKNARVAELEEILYTLGLPERVIRINELAAAITILGEIPKYYGELVKLPGVGDYIASAWLSFSGTSRAVIVDANVARWLARMTGQPYDGETRRQKWVRVLADQLTPTRIYRKYNYAVLDFTREICKPVSPHCEKCPLVKDYCLFGKENLVP